MNILFIGGKGFIGSNIIRQFGNDVSIFMLDPKIDTNSHPLQRDIKIIKGKLSDTDLILDIIKTHNITKIVHLASSLIPGSNFISYISEYNSIIVPTIKLLNICSEKDIQFIFFSSGGTIYGNKHSVESNKETDLMEPISYYGLSKQIIENSILFEHRTSGLKYLILRPSNPYGPGQNIHGHQGIIAVAIGKLLSGESMKIWGDGSSIRDYIYIKDLANIVVQLLKDDITNATINIGSGTGYSVNHIISIINSITKSHLSVEYVKNREVDVSNIILDISLLKSLVKIQLTPLEEGIRQFYNYALLYQNGIN